MRQFLAAELPAALRVHVEGVGSGLRPRLRGWRWVRPEGVHLTLRFLGEVGGERDARARGAWRRVVGAGRAFRVVLTGLGRFPGRGGPRVLWLGLEETEPGGALVDLANRLEAAARDLGWDAEAGPFSPHLTLARARRGTRADEPSLAEQTVERVEGWVRRVTLFESHLERGGARYTALESFALEGDREDRAGA